jgi:hypothetical protein
VLFSDATDAGRSARHKRAADTCIEVARLIPNRSQRTSAIWRNAWRRGEHLLIFSNFNLVSDVVTKVGDVHVPWVAVPAAHLPAHSPS